MILSDKIMKQRKNKGWSQEELAEKMSVSRQSVSKWESSASTPDLNKIIKLSELFDVSTDYLLKDKISENTYSKVDLAIPKTNYNDTNYSRYEEESDIRKITRDEAFEIILTQKESAKSIGIGVALCILSPSILILLDSLYSAGLISMSENFNDVFGVVSLLVCVAIGVSIIIPAGMNLDKYSYIEKENFELEYGVESIVLDEKNDFQKIYMRSISLGVVLCILSCVPLIIFEALYSSNFANDLMVILLLIIVAIAVNMFINAGIVYAMYNRLLQNEEYSKENKVKNKKTESISGVYWSIITAVFLGYSVITGNWGISWIIWPCASALFRIIAIIVSYKRA